MFKRYLIKCSAMSQDCQRYMARDFRNLSFNFVDGKRASPIDSHKAITNYNPARGEELFSFQCSGVNEVNRAVSAAKNAFDNWSKLASSTRGQMLCNAARIIRGRLEEIASLETLDTGKSIWESKVDIAGCADVLEYYGGAAATNKGEHHTLSNGNFAIVKKEPLGVVAGIGAWNYPFQVMTWKLAPALACGNTFVYKPSHFTPLTSVVLAEILTEAGIPVGVVNVVQGDAMTGEAICKNNDIAKVTFTGSVDTGKKIVKTCSDSMKRVTMELGGKSALIVFEDCDMVNAVKATLLGNFLTQGEVCSNCTRVFVHSSILDEFENKLTTAANKMVIGNPEHESTMVGAMISEEHGQNVLDFVNVAKQDGAHVACGGERVNMKDNALKGCFISPCVLTNCKDEMTVVKKEIFGPVVAILAFENEDEAVRRANSLPYGLAAGVMTKDIQRGHRVASNLQAGIVWINNYNIFPPEVPFGGYKLSGFGRENGLAALNDFTQTKTVYVEMNKEISCPIYVQ